MIAVQLTGGLGNQLFQYAMGRSLAIRNNAVLKLDLSFFETYEWHEYSLDPFNIEKNVLQSADRIYFERNKKNLFKRIIRKLFGLQPNYICEKNLSFDEQYLQIKNPAYLFGYWQCENYFKENEQLLRKEFSVKIPPSTENQKLLDEIRGVESVSLHIRRGVFVNVDFVNKTHGTCSMEYYEAAINIISGRFNNPVFYIFSDDINWAKENLEIQHVHRFVDINNDKTDYEDLRLMFSCKHNILANSTFSWWGAWLNNNPDKLVIAPKQWFADPNKNKLSQTIIPNSWIRI